MYYDQKYNAVSFWYGCTDKDCHVKSIEINMDANSLKFNFWTIYVFYFTLINYECFNYKCQHKVSQCMFTKFRSVMNMLKSLPQIWIMQIHVVFFDDRSNCVHIFS